jgi:hypothetical protein
MSQCCHSCVQETEFVSRIHEVDRSLVPVCACCRRVRDGAGHWSPTTPPLAAEEARRVSYGICLECARDLLAAAQGMAGSPPESHGLAPWIVGFAATRDVEKK